MNTLLDELSNELKAARLAKGLSQRALGEKVGTTQARISKTERGTVDLRLTSFIEFARALDLEVMLVPRQAVTAVRGLTRELAADSHGDRPSTSPGAVRRAYRLEDE